MSRPEFTDPEILRTNLASVILQMTALGLGDLAAFPFVEPPDRRSVADGVALLHELGALDGRGPDRRSVAGWPSCRSTRGWAGWCSRRRRNGCVREVLIITAALSIQDPRERPLDHQQAAGEKHARFRDPESDFVAFLNLWRYLQEQQRRCRPTSSASCAVTTSSTTCGYASGRTWRASCARWYAGMGVACSTTNRHRPNGYIWRCWPGLLSHIGLKDIITSRTAEKGGLPRRPGRAIRDLPGLHPVPEATRAG